MNDPNKTSLDGDLITQEFVFKVINQARAKFRVPAIAVAVMNSEKILVEEIRGNKVIDKKDSATLDDFFHIGSCSKSVLALIVEKCVEQEKISWQTRFFDIYPELQDKALNEYQDITLEDLFLCQAGIQPFVTATEKFPEIESSESDLRLGFIKYLVARAPAAKPENGKFQHLYSNASYTMASAMLERVVGQDYETLITDVLTKDLGMSVHIGWPNSYEPDQPWGHLIKKKNVEKFPPENEYKLPYFITPAGDLSLTPRDYARYTQLHLKGLTGKDNYISSSGYQHLHFGHSGFSYGVGNGDLGGHRFSVFDGSAGTFFCRSLIVPESNFAMTIMMNAGSGIATMKAVEWLTTQVVKKHFNWWWRFWL